MIKVIEHGYTKYYVNCLKCHCQFTYELSDINENERVRCPDCGYEHIHSNWADYDCTSQVKEEK